jgi:hypothetical protein
MAAAGRVLLENGTTASCQEIVLPAAPVPTDRACSLDLVGMGEALRHARPCYGAAGGDRTDAGTQPRGQHAALGTQVHYQILVAGRQPGVRDLLHKRHIL